MRTLPIAILAALTIVGAGRTAAGQAPSPDDVDRLLAPIALYPDQLLAQMLLCAGDPRGVTALDAFLKAHPTLKGSEVQDAAVKDNFEASFVAMALFPQVVYVPQYNPQTVYVVQPTTTTNTVVIKEDNSTQVAAAGVIGFTAGIAIGAAMDNHYYYGPYGWHGGAYMYNDAWDDYYDRREDAREDWMDHREDIVEERGDRARDTQEQRTERRETQAEQRTERSGTQSEQRTERQQNRQEKQPSSTYESRGYSQNKERTATQDRSGTRSDAFSGYSSGKSTSAASSRGQSSKGSRSKGGGRRR